MKKRLRFFVVLYVKEKRHMKKVLALTMALALVAASFAGCGNSSSSTSTTAAATTAAAGETAAAAEGTGTVKNGMSGPLTGGASAYGLAVKAGMEVAGEEINAKGGLQIEFNAQDDEADGEKAVSAYNVLKDWGMQVMAGQVTTGGKDDMFQMCFTDPNQGASAAELVSTKYTGSKVGIIYDSSDDYSTGLYNGFKAKAAELGVEIVATTSFTADNKADLSTQVTQCQDAGADLVFLPIYYTEASQILTYANRISYAPKFFGCDGMDGILTVEGFDTSLAEGLALMTPFDANATNEATQSFVAKFKEKMDGLVPNQFAADGYDVIYAIYDAMTAAGITGNESASEICDALKAQFATMTVDGLTGTGMHWDENGMISKSPAAVVVENGVYVPMD